MIKDALLYRNAHSKILISTYMGEPGQWNLLHLVHLSRNLVRHVTACKVRFSLQSTAIYLDRILYYRIFPSGDISGHFLCY